MKSSKYTQASIIKTDNDYGDYQNLSATILLEDGNQKLEQHYKKTTSGTIAGDRNGKTIFVDPAKVGHEVVVGKDRRFSIPATLVPTTGQDIEMICPCVSIYHPVPKPRYDPINNMVLSRSFSATPPKFDQHNNTLERKSEHKQIQLQQQQQQQHQHQHQHQQQQHHYHPHHHQKHVFICEQDKHVLDFERHESSVRTQSPEIINIHRAAAASGSDSGGGTDGGGGGGGGVVGHKNIAFNQHCAENEAFKPCLIDKYDEFYFNRDQNLPKSRLGFNQSSHTKRRHAGDGMDSEIDDSEVVFELSEHLGDCQCACDHIVYSPHYTNCIQEDRMYPAEPDLTRRLGSSKDLAKAEGSPPYYRSASATSSSSNSTSSKIELSSRHWWLIATVLLLAAAAGVCIPVALKINSSASFEERLEFANRLLQEVPLIDGHNDLPWNIRKFLHNKLKNFKFDQDLRHVTPWSTSVWSHTDLTRLEAGQVAAQFWAAYVPCDSQYKDAVQLTLEQIDVIRRFTDLYHPRLTLCTSSEDIKNAYKKHQVCSLIGVEGGHSLAGSLAVLRTLYHVGVRYLTLTSTCNTPWADCSHADMPGKKPEHGGLTTFGKSVVKEMNRLGMIVDLSHVSVRTMRDALDVSKAPVIFSHSSAHALCNSTRNVPDATLRKLALNKGVVMVNFYTQFLTCRDAATIADAVAHINHIREVAGVDNVGLGAGYDGINYVPQGLEDVSSYPSLFAELIGTGKWSVEDLKKLAGLNFLRVMEDVEKIRDEFKKANVPPYEDVLIPKPKTNCSSQDHF